MMISSTLFFLLVAILALMPTLGRSQNSSNHAWTDLDRSKDIAEAFGNRTYSFDVTDNWKICMSHVLNIPYRAGIANYAPLISKALEIVEELGGGSIRLSSATYPIASTIDMPSHTCIIGAGPSETILKLVDFAKSFYPAKGIIRSRKGERVSVQGVTIDGNKMRQSMNPVDLQGRNGVHFELVNYAWLRNVKAYNNSGHGFQLHGSNNQWSYHLVVEGTSAESNGKDGINIGETFYGSVFNCLAYKNFRHGVSVTAGAMHIVVKRNQISGSGGKSEGCGIYIKSEGSLNTRSVLLVENQIHNSVLAGLCLNDVSQIAVQKGNITDTNKWGSFCYDVRNTAAFTISNDTTCTVRSGVSFNPRNASALPTIPSPPAVPSNGTGVPGAPVIPPPRTQRASTGCGAGIGDRDVCCPLICGACGGIGCGAKLPEGKCCYDEIKNKGSNCVLSPPPCVLGM